MSKPVRYEVGDIIRITEANLATMRNSNRSCVTAGYPSDSFIEKASRVERVDGVVTHTFPPGYEVTAEVGGQSFHMKDNWITKYSAEHMREDIRGKLVQMDAADLSNNEINRVFDGCVLQDYCIREAQKAQAAGITMDEIRESIELKPDNRAKLKP